MGSEIPQPADDEFEARLSWSPSGDDKERPAPSHRARPTPARPRSAPLSAPAATDVSTAPRRDDVRIDAVELAAVHEELRAVRRELEVMRSLFEELLGEDPVAALEDPDRSASELGATMRVRLRRRSTTR